VKQQGKFILMTINEFKQWISKQTVKRKIKLIQQHHTYSPDYNDWAKKPDHFYWCKEMEEYHTKERKPPFNEIAQNITTFPDGMIAICRPLETVPAGIVGANKYGICIEHIGNFDTGKDSMNQAHRETIVKINALLCAKFALTPNTDSIVYHHWFDRHTGKRTNGTGNVKSCPGSAFFGTNTIESAVNNFIPLIEAELKKVKA
jgi:hypothetical protein